MNSSFKHKIWFFAGGETRDNKFNVFTGSYIELMKRIAGEDFDFVKGVFYKSTARNVFWALNNAQKLFKNPERIKLLTVASDQILGSLRSSEDQLIIVSSSSGSVIAAQTACLLASKNKIVKRISKPFHLVLGASMISPESDLYKNLLKFQDEGEIGTILHDSIQDEGDTSFGIGGISRIDAYRNAFGIMFPILSQKYQYPSFLNSKPETGHIHRKRSNTLQKAIDYVEIVMIQHKLAGENHCEKAKEVLQKI